VMCTGFPMPLDSALPGWFAGLPSWREAGFTTCGARVGAQLVAAATLFVHHGVGNAGSGSSKPTSAATGSGARRTGFPVV
jgi:hypothetical protein